MACNRHQTILWMLKHLLCEFFFRLAYPTNIQTHVMCVIILWRIQIHGVRCLVPSCFPYLVHYVSLFYFYSHSYMYAPNIMYVESFSPNCLISYENFWIFKINLKHLFGIIVCVTIIRTSRLNHLQWQFLIFRNFYIFMLTFTWLKNNQKI